MTDITIVWDPTSGRGDWAFSPPDLVTGNDLQTAVLISLFTDGQAGADDRIPDGTNDPRGWWGDQDETVRIGSRLWLFERSKANAQTLTAVRDAINGALKWLIDDGVVARIDVSVEWTQPGMLGAQIGLFRQDGTKVAVNFSWVWQGIA